MTFDPILSAPPAVQVHLIAAAFAVLIGPFVLYRRRRDLLHKSLGRVWVAAMAVLAISGFFIPAFVLPLVGPFGPIHLLSAWVLISLVGGVRAIRSGQRDTHRAAMTSLYWQALGIAGLFTLLPGRRLNVALFGEAERLGLWVIGTVVIIGLGLVAVRRWRSGRAGSFSQRSGLDGKS